MYYLIESFAWCMLQVTLFALVAGLVYAVGRRWRTDLNAILLAASLAVVGILTLFSISPWPRWEAPHWEWRAATTSGEETSIEVRSAERPKTQPPELLTLDTDLPALKSPDVAELENSKAEVAQSAPQSAWRLLVYAAWAATAVGLVRAIIGLIQLRCICRPSVPVDDPAALQVFDELREQVGVRWRVQLRETPKLNGAAAVGWRCPLVLMPSVWREWSPAELRAVLAHELAHVRQQHFLSYLVSQAAVVAHYYHPLVHWLARRLRLEQEIDADRFAADVFGERHQYAVILARLALRPARPEATFAGMGLFMSRPLLMRRIAMLRGNSDSTRGSSRVVTGVVLALLLLAAIGVSGLRKRPAIAEEVSSASKQPVPGEDDEGSAAKANAPELSREETPQQPGVVDRPAIDVAEPVEVTALLQISGWPDRMLPDDGKAVESWKTIGKTQVTLLKSYWVLQSAVTEPEIAKLPIVRSQKSPIAWLQNKLVVGVYPDTNLLYVSMSASAEEAQQAAKLVDAVVDAYMNRVVNTGFKRQLAARDALARRLNKLNGEISRKMQELYDIAKVVGSAEDGGSGELMQQLVMRRLDRVETELMRLEDELEKLKSGSKEEQAKLAPYYDQRMAQLRKRQEELVETLRASSEKSVDLSTRKIELEQLQRITEEMSRKLELMDISLSGPDSQGAIQVIQRAAESVPLEEPENAGNGPQPEVEP